MAEPAKKSALRKLLSELYNRTVACGARLFLLNNGSLIRGNEKCNAYVYERLKDDKPFMLMRLGVSEIRWFSLYDLKKYHPGRKPGPRDMVYDWPEDNLEEYGEVFSECYENADAACVWYISKIGEAEMLHKYAPRAARLDPGFLNVINGFDMKGPFWLKALEGKKVLVVTPFDEAVKHQYERRNEIYPEGFIPEFGELIVYKSVWFISKEKELHDPRFNTWFEALEKQRRDIEKLDFDIALLGCGPFGAPLQVTIRKMGKKSVYLGGELQLYFGIKGKRWDNDTSGIAKYYNDSWISLTEDTRPRGAERLDMNCYW